MEFGQTTTLEGVDFALGPDDERTARVLAAAVRGPLRVNVGATGYSMREWVGTVYPPGTPAERHLGEYGRQFNGIELNATAYRVPEPDQIARWRDAVPDGFRFAPKFPQDIGSRVNLASQAEAARAFAERLSELGDRLGRALLQLSPAIAPAQAQELGVLLDALPEGFPVAVEFRHPAWFRDRRLVPAAFDLLAARGAAAVITDVAGRRDVSHASLPAPAVFVRFVGNGLHPTDTTRLDAWASRLARWIDAGLGEAQFFLHQPDNLLAPEASNLFLERLNRAAGLALAPWKPHPPRAKQLSLL